MRKVLILCFLLISGLGFTQQLLAQGVGVAISPLTFELTGNPGDVIENQIKVTNTSDSVALGIKMTAEDIAPGGEGGEVIVEAPGTETYSLAKWVTIEPEDFILGPKEEKWVKFAITIPENAEPGGKYGTVVAGSGILPGGTPGTAISTRVGISILLTVPGAVEENLIIKDFTAPRYSEYGPINFTVRFENTGTVHVRPKSMVTITNWRGKKVADVPFSEKIVLPGAIRKWEASWDQKWLWAGKYIATLTGNYGISNAALIPVVINFWVFPWKFGLIILLILIILILTRRRWAAAFKVLIKGEGKS